MRGPSASEQNCSPHRSPPNLAIYAQTVVSHAQLRMRASSGLLPGCQDGGGIKVSVPVAASGARKKCKFWRAACWPGVRAALPAGKRAISRSIRTPKIP
jgi:hypothetical protein